MFSDRECKWTIDMDIRDITSAIRDGRLRITDHAEEAAVDDHLAWDDIYYDETV